MVLPLTSLSPNLRSLICKMGCGRRSQAPSSVTFCFRLYFLCTFALFLSPVVRFFLFWALPAPFLWLVWPHRFLLRDLFCYSRKCHEGETSFGSPGVRKEANSSARLGRESASPKGLQDRSSSGCRCHSPGLAGRAAGRQALGRGGGPGGRSAVCPASPTGPLTLGGDALHEHVDDNDGARTADAGAAERRGAIRGPARTSRKRRQGRGAGGGCRHSTGRGGA